MPQLFASRQFLSSFGTPFNRYEHMTGISLEEHPLFKQLKSCHSTEDIIALIQDRAKAFSDIGGTNTINKSIETIVSTFTRLAGDFVRLTSSTAAIAILTGLGILFDTVNGMLCRSNVLADLLDSIEGLFNRLEAYTLAPSTLKGDDDEFSRSFGGLLESLGLATRQLKQRRPPQLVNNSFGVEAIKEAKQDVDRLFLPLDCPHP